MLPRTPPRSSLPQTQSGGSNGLRQTTAWRQAAAVLTGAVGALGVSRCAARAVGVGFPRRLRADVRPGLLVGLGLGLPAAGRLAARLIVDVLRALVRGAAGLALLAVLAREAERVDAADLVEARRRARLGPLAPADLRGVVAVGDQVKGAEVVAPGRQPAAGAVVPLGPAAREGHCPQAGASEGTHTPAGRG